MVGLPGQTFKDLANDLHFFRDIKADMIGSGPYVYAEGTPIGNVWRQRHPVETHDEKV